MAKDSRNGLFVGWLVVVEPINCKGMNVMGISAYHLGIGPRILNYQHDLTIITINHWLRRYITNYGNLLELRSGAG